MLLASCGRGPTVAVSDPGVSVELAQLRKATLSEIRYRIQLDIPESVDRKISGTARIDFLWSDASGRDLVLDFRNPAERVDWIKANGVEVTPEFQADHILVRARDLLPEGRNRVTLGITAGDEALNRNPGFLYTLFVPDRAHFSLPVFDQPDLKSRITWDLIIPRRWNAIANAPLEQRSAARDSAFAGDRDRLIFAESDPLPTYLFAFAAGEFESIRREINGRRMELLHRETDREKLERNLDAIFGLHATSLQWLEDYTGLEYPFSSFGFVLIPSFQYGGMEHPGAITYRASSLLLEENATEAQYLGRASLIAHETAHMWFGDLVTMAWFDDVWTKEVFANFMAAKIVHPAFPAVDHDLRFLLAHHPAAYAVDRTRGANPIRQALENLNQAGTLYGAIIYRKAPIVMKHLEQRVGEEDFRKGMREYLSRYAYSNADWNDLVHILDEFEPSDLRVWSDVWVEQPGRPTISLQREGDGQPGIVLQQTDPWSRDRVWPQRLEVAFLSDSESDAPRLLHRAQVELRGASVEVPIPAAARDAKTVFVIPNSGGVEYGLFEPDPASLSFLVERHAQLEDPLLRGVAWLTLWDAMLEDRLPPETLLSAAVLSIETEPAEQLVSRILTDVTQTYWRFLTESQRRRWSGVLEDAVWSAVEASETRTRRAEFFTTYIELASSREAVARIGRIWSGEEDVPGLSLSQRDRIAMARVLALHEAPGWRQILDAQASKIRNPDRLAEFDYLRDSLDADPEIRRAFFESLRDPASRHREPWVLQGLANIHHPLRAPAAIPLVLPALEMLEEIQKTGDIFFPAGWLAATLGGHNSPEVVEIVSAFLAARPDYPPRLAGKILQASDMVERAARISL
jgi:aminopeptidase N